MSVMIRVNSVLLVFQVGKLRKNYQEWVHKPELGKPRFFRSEFCEQLSKTNWWVVPLVWIPVSISLVFLSLWRCEGLVGSGDGLGSVRPAGGETDSRRRPARDEGSLGLSGASQGVVKIHGLNFQYTIEIRFQRHY